MANQVPDRDFQDRNVEVPGDTNSADIVGRTGEQMPQQSHDGLESEAREPSARVKEEDQDPARDDQRTHIERYGRE
jgi:hypothetical protein